MKTAKSPRRRASKSAVLGWLVLMIGLAATTTAAVATAEDAPSSVSYRVVEVEVVDRRQLQRLSEDNDLWAYLEGPGLAILQVADDGLASLDAAGVVYRVDLERTSRLAQLGQTLPGQASGIPGFPCYRTVEETFATAEALVATYPDLATWIDIGDSWEKTQNAAQGYDLLVLRLTAGFVGVSKPSLFINSGLHAREYTTAELATRFAEYLVAHYDRDPDVTWLLDHHAVHLLLQANPDGRKRAEAGALWRKNANNNYCTGSSLRGADLNRNFAFQWNCCGGSSADPCSTLFHGAAAASEPEVQAIEAYLRQIIADRRPPALNVPAPDDTAGLVLDLHSFGEDVLWSWGFTDTQPAEPNGSQLYTLGRKYGFFTHYRPQHGSFTTINGPTKDFAYGELGAPGFTIELGSDFFESCQDFEAIMVRDHLPALLYAAKVAAAPYRLPSGPEVLSPSAPPVAVAASDVVAGEVLAGEVVPLTATVDDSRYTSLNGAEPVQNVAGVEVFVDLPPWRSGARGIAMQAIDGSFDSPREVAQLDLDTSGLAPGRHLLYFQGQDSDGHRGAVSAAFLHVVDPQSAPFLEGVLRDAETGQPVVAQVRVGSFETVSQAGGGFYRLQVPAGTYDVVVESPQHARQQLTVVLNDFATEVQDFQLRPYVDVLTDDVDGDPVDGDPAAGDPVAGDPVDEARLEVDEDSAYQAWCRELRELGESLACRKLSEALSGDAEEEASPKSASTEPSEISQGTQDLSPGGRWRRPGDGFLTRAAMVLLALGMAHWSGRWLEDRETVVVQAAMGQQQSRLEQSLAALRVEKKELLGQLQSLVGGTLSGPLGWAMIDGSRARSGAEVIRLPEKAAWVAMLLELPSLRDGARLEIVRRSDGEVIWQDSRIGIADWEEKNLVIVPAGLLPDGSYGLRVVPATGDGLQPIFATDLEVARLK